MASLNVGSLGEYLREQRRSAQLSLRQLADAAGVSNPYLSQIERGLRKPSAEVLQQVAKALRISAETLYVRAGILDAERDREECRRDGETTAVLLADPTLTERQKQVLLQIYESFRKENGFVAGPRDAARAQDGQGGDDAPGGAPGGARDGVLDDVRGGVPDGVPDGVREDALDDSSIRGPRAAGARTRKAGGDDAAPRRTAG